MTVPKAIKVRSNLIFSEDLRSIKKSKIKYPNKTLIGNSPGYIRKESVKLPSNKKEMDR